MLFEGVLIPWNFFVVTIDGVLGFDEVCKNLFILQKLKNHDGFFFILYGDRMK